MLKAGDDARKTGPEWKRLVAALVGLKAKVRTVGERLAGARRVLGMGTVPHPYEVRQKPASDTTWAASDWRHFRVEGGTVNGVTVAAVEFTAPDDVAAMLVWLDISGTVTGPLFAPEDVSVEHGEDGWTDFPAPATGLDRCYVLLAIITLDQEAQTAVIRQNVRASLTVGPMVSANHEERVLRAWSPDNHGAPGVTDSEVRALDADCCGCAEWGGCSYQQIAGWAMLTGYAPLDTTTGTEALVDTCYDTAEVSGEPTKAGLSLAEPVSAYSTTISQPRPDKFVGLYPRNSTLWDGYPVVWDIYADRNVPGFSHNPDGYWFYLTNQPGWSNFLGEIHFSNGIGADNGGAAAWREAMYWIDEPGTPSATAITADGRSMVTPIGGSLPATVYETADAAGAELSGEVTEADARAELTARLGATTYPLSGGPGINRVYDRDTTHALRHNWQSPLNYNVLKTCQWCIGEDTHPTAPHFYNVLASSAGLCPTSHPMSEDFAAPRPSCRKAPPGPWWDRSCANDATDTETNIRYFAINYHGWVKLDRHKWVEAEHEDMGTVARREYDEDFPKRRAWWAASIYVSGLAPGQPYIERFCPQDGSACTDDELVAPECPEEDPECTSVSFQVGFGEGEEDRWGYKKVICLPAP